MTKEEYFIEREKSVQKFLDDEDIIAARYQFERAIHKTDYVKRWSWMGQPVMQLPTDLMAIQEIICHVEPDYLIETGVAYGGALLFYASVMESIEWGHVIGVDIEIREPNRRAITESPLSSRITLIEEDSLVGFAARMFTDDFTKVIVVLDSNHTHDHVLKELLLYAPLVSIGSYIIVMDTTIEFMDQSLIPYDRPWRRGSNPWTAVQEFLTTNHDFEVDHSITDTIMLSSAVGGYLRRVR